MDLHAYVLSLYLLSPSSLPLPTSSPSLLLYTFLFPPHTNDCSPYLSLFHHSLTFPPPHIYLLSSLSYPSHTIHALLSFSCPHIYLPLSASAFPSRICNLPPAFLLRSLRPHSARPLIPCSVTVRVPKQCLPHLTSSLPSPSPIWALLPPPFPPTIYLALSLSSPPHICCSLLSPPNLPLPVIPSSFYLPHIYLLSPSISLRLTPPSLPSPFPSHTACSLRLFPTTICLLSPAPSPLPLTSTLHSLHSSSSSYRPSPSLPSIYLLSLSFHSHIHLPPLSLSFLPICLLPPFAPPTDLPLLLPLLHRRHSVYLHTLPLTSLRRHHTSLFPSPPPTSYPSSSLRYRIGSYPSSRCSPHLPSSLISLLLPLTPDDLLSLSPSLTPNLLLSAPLLPAPQDHGSNISFCLPPLLAQLFTSRHIASLNLLLLSSRP
ncbi:hypothetical protein C7M84_013905 [Penaeus vannamei]|uniref:Uncharacterized protein n=1 Tax=Penaeus vannamei TaxID=6689 RepID=A0A3R7SN28_PENVA|nr:hypothetical protein C7M84_013905 [Penaeus vannamei]